MPLYAIEVKLAPTPPSRAVGDLSQAPTNNKYEELAQELETAALLGPTPEPGLTGEAATYFPAIFDLLGGCAEPFYRRFSSSPSLETSPSRDQRVTTYPVTSHDVQEQR
jgi:hypothetical protein